MPTSIEIGTDSASLTVLLPVYDIVFGTFETRTALRRRPAYATALPTGSPACCAFATCRRLRNRPLRCAAA